MSNKYAVLRTFVAAVTEIMGDQMPESSLLLRLRPLLEDLVSEDNWLPDEFSQPHPDHCQQYLLYCDPLERFSVVSFVLGAGQKTPPHDHPSWGLIGNLRGGENYRSFKLENGQLVAGAIQRLTPGKLTFVRPEIGDAHELTNAFPDRVSISIHVYGCNIGLIGRHSFDPITGRRDDFIIGYANAYLPNLWSGSEQVAESKSSEVHQRIFH